jgi:hypothetical protein
MKFIKSKKGIALLATLVVAAAAAFGAYAYFSSSGNGSGTGTVGSSSGFTVTGASEASDLFPYLPAQYTATPSLWTALTGGKVVNPGTGNENLHQIVATIEAPTNLQGDVPACTASDFSFFSPTSSWTISNGGDTATITPDDDLASNAEYDMTDLSIGMVDNSANQDDCQGATVNISYAAS